MGERSISRNETLLPRYGCSSQRGGIALLGALLATIVIAALLASLFFAVSEETRTGSAIERRDRALAAAESAIEIGLDRLGTGPREHPAIGAVETHSLDGDGIPSVVHITRLDSSLFWLVAVVGDASDPAAVTRRIGVLATATRHSSDSIAIVRRAERGWSELF